MSQSEGRQPVPPVARIAARRERVIEALGAHFAEDHLSVDELEARIERALKAESDEALDALLAGLPALPEAARAPARPGVADAAVVPRRGAPHGVRQERRTIVAFMGGVVRRGVWTVPARVRAVAFMGGVELDLREVTLPPGVTEIRAVAVMGAVVVRVPPHVRVESDGIAILGGFEDQLDQPAPADPSAPVVRLTGFSFLGGVEAKVDAPASPP